MLWQVNMCIINIIITFTEACMKKFFSMLIVMAILLPPCLGCINAYAAETPKPYRRGDASGNGVIDIADYIAVRLDVLGVSPLSDQAKIAGDVDGNGVVGVSDYIYIRLHILGVAYISENETASRVDAMYDGIADRTLDKVNVLKGKKYTYSKAPSVDYPDESNVKLTDGKISEKFDKDNWAGLYMQNTAEITFDLGEVTSGLTDLKVYALNQKSYGISLYPKMDVSVSKDGKDYNYLNTVNAPSDVSDDENFFYELNLQDTFSARYVRLTFSGRTPTWFFICEVELYSYGENYEDSYYGPFKPEKITTPKYWNSTDSDYDTSKNMIKGLSYQIKPLVPIKEAHQTDYYNAKVTNKALTDGVKTSSTSYSNSAYFHFTQSEGRFILFDLGALSTVTSFNGEFLMDSGTGITPPTRVAVYVSEDGEKFGKAGSARFTAPTTNQVFKATFNFDKKYKARYVIVYIQINSHAWCSELEIFGTKKVQSDAVSAAAIDYVKDAKEGNFEIGDKDGYLMPKDFMGVNNVLLSYHCLRSDTGAHREEGLITVDEYLPYVGYYDKNNVLKDTFMDGFLYLPYTAFNYSDYGGSLEGWKFYIENQFTPDRNVDALNKAVGQVKTQLNKNDYKVSVFFSILYTFRKFQSGNVNNFGDLDGDGKNENFNNIEDRKKAIKWIIDQQIEKFNTGNYGNLDLKGFYWFEESLGGDTHDKELVKYAADYLHSMGYVLFWIPWYRASGYDKWEEFGFDAACMQPNYAFNGEIPISRLYDNAAYARALGMCVEFESDGTSYAAVKKIKDYLYVGIETGYMHAVKMYYQGGVPGDIYNAYKSKDPYVRSAYDEIYLYSKAKLTKSDFYQVGAVDDPYLKSSDSKGGKYTGVIAVDTDYTCKIRVAVSPKYGTLKLNYNGTYEYIPFAGFKGTDTFTVYADFTTKVSGTITITINVN